MERTIAAKPTLYRGVAFRSRLEARWAIVFEGFGLKWEYEPKTFELLDLDKEGARHLWTPDFRVTREATEDCSAVGFYAEVKPCTNLAQEWLPWGLLNLLRRDESIIGEAGDGIALLGKIPACGSPDARHAPVWRFLSRMHDEAPKTHGFAFYEGGDLVECAHFYGSPNGVPVVWEPSFLPDVPATPGMLEPYQRAALATLEDA